MNMNTFRKSIHFRLFLIFTSLIILLNSCDKIKELITVSISTTIEGNIPIQGNGGTALSPDLGVTKASFVLYDIKQDISIADNPDLKPYLKKIQEIEIESVQVVFNGLQTDQTIDLITIDVLGDGTLVSLNNVTMSNNTFSPNVSSLLLKSVSDNLLKNNKITVNIIVRANSLINANVAIKMNAKIKAQALD